MEPELTQRLATLEEKVDKMYASVEKLRKYFLWTGIITVLLFVLPLIGLVFAIPSFLSTYSQINSIGNF
jgi:predicted ferric reductase